MKTGASVSDSQGITWTLGQELGSGPCGRTFVARSAQGGEAALTVSHPESAFPTDGAELAAACAAALTEQATWMRERTRSWLPDLADSFEHEGRQVLLSPRPTATLSSRIKAGAPLAALLDVLIEVCNAVSTGTHGHLQPDDIQLFDDGGVRLAAPASPATQSITARLPTNAARAVLPPEATGSPTSGWDTYALCLALYRAASIAPAGPDGRRTDPPSLPNGGLDKVALSAVKDRVHARLQQERANPRFSSRVADKLGAVLNRGLSRQPAPSPPYRFATANELAGRLREVRALIDPKVEAVGKVLLSTDARDGMFEGGATATFSTTVTVTAGAGQDDLATGLLVRDLDAEGDDRVPVPDARYAVKPHPSGRLRFDFELPELRPGRYTVRAAFTIKDSGHEPATTDGHFEIRPPPGYVPPAEEPAPEASALRFPGATSTPRMSSELDAPGFGPQASDPFADDGSYGDDSFSEDDVFPSPIAPSDPGSSPAADAPPPPLLHAVPTPVPGSVPRAGAPTAPPGMAPDPSPSSATPGSLHRLGIAPSQADSTSGEGPATTPSAPGLAAIPSIRPSQAGSPSDPSADVTREAPSSSPSWGPGSGQWEELPGLDPLVPGGPSGLPGLDEPAGGGLLPTPEGMTDLPGFEDPRPDALGALIEQATTFLRENAMVALAIVVGVLVLLLVLAGLIFQAMAG